jgi:hypothetical protein
MDKVRIGPIWYTLEKVKDLRSPDDERLYGRVQFSTCEIMLEEGLSPSLEPITLWHEMLHAALQQSGLVLANEEQLVTILSHSIVGILRDNPELRDR